MSDQIVVKFAGTNIPIVLQRTYGATYIAVATVGNALHPLLGSFFLRVEEGLASLQMQQRKIKVPVGPRQNGTVPVLTMVKTEWIKDLTEYENESNGKGSETKGEAGTEKEVPLRQLDPTPKDGPTA